MDTKDKGLELASRFSSITNRLRYCGPKDAYVDFYKLLKEEKYDKEKIRVHFKKYEGLYVYLDYISKKLKKDFLDYNVIESYWLGNKFLDQFTKEDLKNIVMKLVERGLPEKYASEIAKKIPDGMNPHHSFNVLFVGVGRTTGSVPTNILTMNKCTVLTGRVLKMQKETLIAAVEPLVVKNGIMQYDKYEMQHIEYIKEFMQGLKINDYIAIHWDFACKKLSDKELTNVKKYTQKNIDALNYVKFFKN